MDASSIAPFIQAGGVIAFATAVWFELRAQRAERRAENEKTREILEVVRDNLAALLERDRMRETPAHGVPVYGPTRPPGR